MTRLPPRGRASPVPPCGAGALRHLSVGGECGRGRTFRLSQSRQAGRAAAPREASGPCALQPRTGTVGPTPCEVEAWGQRDKWIDVCFRVRNESVCEQRGLEVWAPGWTFPRKPRQEQHSAPCRGWGVGQWELDCPLPLGSPSGGPQGLRERGVRTGLGTNTRVSGILAAPHSRARAARPACWLAHALPRHWAPTTGLAARVRGWPHTWKWWLSWRHHGSKFGGVLSFSAFWAHVTT